MVFFHQELKHDSMAGYKVTAIEDNNQKPLYTKNY